MPLVSLNNVPERNLPTSLRPHHVFHLGFWGSYSSSTGDLWPSTKTPLRTVLHSNCRGDGLLAGSPVEDLRRARYRLRITVQQHAAADIQIFCSVLTRCYRIPPGGVLRVPDLSSNYFLSAFSRDRDPHSESVPSAPAREGRNTRHLHHRC